MSDLRALIRLKEKELRCLEWSLMAQKAQEAAGVFVPESIHEELEARTPEQQVGPTFNCTFSNNPKSRWKEPEGAGRWSIVADSIQIWVSHMGNHTSTKAESLQGKSDILVPRGLLLGCPDASAQICTAPHTSVIGKGQKKWQAASWHT